jgi:hypothetical protein
MDVEALAARIVEDREDQLPIRSGLDLCGAVRQGT